MPQPTHEMTPTPSSDIALTAVGANFDSAISAWKKILGSTHVLDDLATINRYQQSASGDSAPSLAVIRPQSYDQVQQTTKIAAEYGIKLYPISTGNNWGYGANNPVDHDRCIIDLSDLISIRFVDAELGLVPVDG